MCWDENGQERFCPGTEIYEQWTSYNTAKELANLAITAYNETKHQLPRRPRVSEGPNAAWGQDDGLKGNFTISERG
jgi:hypothetical protein